MSFICPILECVYCLGCVRWIWQKCLYTAGCDSEKWCLATAEDFEPVPRFCRLVLAVYEDDIRNPQWEPSGGYGINPDWVILRKDYAVTQGHVTPYLIYLDHEHGDIILAVRGLSLAMESDYAVLLDNRLGQMEFHGGYVHNGLLKAACWLLDAECEVLSDLIAKNPTYKLTFIGHSLGSGVVALLTLLALHNRDKLEIDRKRIRCFAMAPTRCMSLNLAVRYADVINSVVLQDTCTLEEKMLQDPRRLYVPGRLYHIVERKPFRMGRLPPVVRTAVPVDGRFEHVVISCNAIVDHSIVWIERRAQRALDLILEKDKILEIPAKQRMERQESIVRDHSDSYQAALRRAVDLDIPHAYSPRTYGTFHDLESGQGSGTMSLKESGSFNRRKGGWNYFVERLFDVDDSGQIVFKKG